MDKANEIQCEVTDIGVAIIDSKLIHNLGKLGHEWARKQASSRQQFTSRDLMGRVRQKYSIGVDDDGNGEINWKTLGEDAAQYFAWTPGATFLCAPASADLRVRSRSARQPAQPRRPVEEIRPVDASEQVGEQKDAALAKRMKQLNDFLAEHGEVTPEARTIQYRGYRIGSGGSSTRARATPLHKHTQWLYNLRASFHKEQSAISHRD
jgi:hypothetical protein